MESTARDADFEIDLMNDVVPDDSKPNIQDSLYLEKINSGSPLIWDNRGKRNVALNPSQQHVPIFPYDVSLRPPRPLLPKHRTPTIFIGISAFRDPIRCGRTLLTALKGAEDPTRVIIGVVDQHLESDDLCLAQYCEQAKAIGYTNAKDECLHIDRIRVLLKSATESKGPTYARSLQQTLIKDEDFCLQVDAHSIFTENWDSAYIEEWLKINNEMGVLSTYLNDYNTYSSWPKDQHPHLCAAVAGEHGLVRNDGASVISSVHKPQLSCFWGAGLSFAKCHSEKRIPLDPYTHWIFDGEEYMKASRLWTSGYDIYTPTIFKIYHDYQSVPHRFESLKIDPAIKRLEQLMGLNRMKLILGLPYEGEVTKVDLEKYSMGNIRSYASYLNFSGINMMNRELDENRCIQLHWVPYTHFEPIKDLVQQQLEAGAMFYPPYIDGIPIYYSSKNSNLRGKDNLRNRIRGEMNNSHDSVTFNFYFLAALMCGIGVLLRKYSHILFRKKLRGSSK